MIIMIAITTIADDIMILIDTHTASMIVNYLATIKVLIILEICIMLIKLTK